MCGKKCQKQRTDLYGATQIHADGKTSVNQNIEQLTCSNQSVTQMIVWYITHRIHVWYIW